MQRKLRGKLRSLLVKPEGSSRQLVPKARNTRRETEMFKLAGQIDKEGKDLNQLKCIKDNPKQVLMGDNKV